jgi:hypothetical protein
MFYGLAGRKSGAFIPERAGIGNVRRRISQPCRAGLVEKVTKSVSPVGKTSKCLRGMIYKIMNHIQKINDSFFGTTPALR